MSLAALHGVHFFFTVPQSTTGGCLWRTDGTRQGTVVVKGMCGDWLWRPGYLTSVGDALFFTNKSGINGSRGASGRAM